MPRSTGVSRMPEMYAGMLHSMETGDPRSALAFWRSKRWTGDERARMRRLLSSAVDVKREVAP